MNIKPLKDRIIIEAFEVEEKTYSGIYLSTSEKEPPQQGVVRAIGKGITELKEGDKVIFTKFGLNEVEAKDKKYLVARLEDILAIYE